MLLINHTDYLQVFNIRFRVKRKSVFPPNQISPRQAACGETQEGKEEVEVGKEEEEEEERKEEKKEEEKEKVNGKKEKEEEKEEEKREKQSLQ